MNPLKQKDIKILDSIGLDDTRRKIGEIVKWINHQTEEELNKFLKEKNSQDLHNFEGAEIMAMKSEIFSYIDDLKWDGRLSFCQFIANLKDFIKKL